MELNQELIANNQQSTTRFFLAIFFLCNFFLSIFFIDLETANSNTTSRVLPVVAFFEEGNFCIDKYEKLTIDKVFVKEHYYSDKAPLQSWLTIPFVGMLKVFGLVDLNANADNWLFIYIIGAVLFGSISFTLLLVLTFFSVQTKNAASKNISPILLSVLPFYASFIFVFSGTFFGHIFSGLLLLLAYIFVKKGNYFISGFFLGLCFLSEYTLALFVLIWTLQIGWNEKKIKYMLIFALGFLPSLIAIFIYNYSITGSPIDMLYKYHIFDNMDQNYGFNGPSLNSLWGLSFGTYRGMFLYAPFLLLLIYFCIRKLPEFKWETMFNNYLFLSCIIFFFFIASYSYWDGGWTYGPRFLTGITILLLYEGVIHFSKNLISKKMFWILILFGFSCALMSKATTIYSLPNGIQNPISERIVPEFLNGHFNENNILSRLFGTPPIYAFLIFVTLFIGMIFSLNYWYTKKFT